MNSSTLPLLTADEITWDLEPEAVEPVDDDLLTAAVIDAESYRTLAVTAIHALHDLQQRHDRLNEQHRRELDEARRLRAFIVKIDAARPEAA